MNVRFRRVGQRLSAKLISDRWCRARPPLPLHPKLRAEIAGRSASELTFLMTEDGKPFTPTGFANWFKECAKRAGLPEKSSPHGLRKAAARILAEAGCSVLEIAAITGHASLKEAERYTKSAEQRRLADAAMRAIQHVLGTAAVKPRCQTPAT